MKTAVVTGASGFVGKALTECLLKQGTNVYAIVRNPEKLADLKQYSNLKVIKADFNGYLKLPKMIDQDIEVFYHFAWNGTSGLSLGDYALQLSNVRYAGDAVTAAIGLSCKKFVYAGTIGEFEAKQCVEMDDSQIRLAGIYGAAKLTADIICKALANNGKIEYCTAMLPYAFGPGDRTVRLQNILIEKLIKNERPKLVSGNNPYDLVYIDDVVNMLALVGEKGKDKKIYYLGNRNIKTMKQTILEIRDIINPNMQLVFGELNDSSAFDYSQINVNSIYEDMGYEPTSDFKESILKTAEWIKTIFSKKIVDKKSKDADVIVVGAGFAGSILARKLAEENNLKVLILEQRPHIGGNMYDEIDENGVLVQRYGPHFLYADKYWIIDFVSHYTELVPYDVKCLSFVDGHYIQLPFNFKTVQQLLGPQKAEHLINKLKKTFIGRDRVPIFELVEHTDSEIRAYGELLFDKAYKTYVAKQWGLRPDQIDRSVLNRVPMAMSYDERYINKDFQYMPKYGFTKIFENMLNHPNIEVHLNCNALDKLTLDEKNHRVLYQGKEYKQIIFTGAIDELFKEKYDSLPYRSLDIHYHTEKNLGLLPSDIVSYPQADGYTRKTEYKRFNCQEDTGYTTISIEYPLQYDKHSERGNLPYYPIINDQNIEKYNQYLKDAQKYENLFLCGRLAEYKYYNMDATIESTFEKYEKLKLKMGL